MRLVVAVVGIGSMAMLERVGGAVEPVYPGKTWSVKHPNEVGPDAARGGGTASSTVSESGSTGAVDGLVMPFLSFDGPAVPLNKAGAPYPNQYPPQGAASVRLDTSDAVSGQSIRVDLTQGLFYVQFNAHNPNGTRGFAREYVARPNAWRFNTYNRLSFWIKCPANAQPLATGGRHNMDVGTYVKRIKGADARSDETGGGHWYHWLNIPPTGTWTRVLINTHPHHLRGSSGGLERGNQPHPTREPEYNYFDTLTRFYISAQGVGPPKSYPAVYRLDEFTFYREPRPENDEQVYSIAATYVPAERRLILTWSRPKGENAVRHEVRYAFSDIHEMGWAKATPAPEGVIRPSGWQGYNGMVYDTANLPLAGKPEVYLAIKPENSQVFSQIMLSLPPKSREMVGNPRPSSRLLTSFFSGPLAFLAAKSIEG